MLRVCALQAQLDNPVARACIDSAFICLGRFSSITAVAPCWLTTMLLSAAAAEAKHDAGGPPQHASCCCAAAPLCQRSDRAAVLSIVATSCS